MVMAQDSTHPTGVSTDNEKTPEVIRARDRKASAAIQLKAGGADWSQIAEILGYPTARAALVATENALVKELRSESKDFLIKMADKRLETLLRGIWNKAIDPTNPEQMVAVSKARELIADHRRLNGLDKPTDIAIYSPTQAELEAWVAEHVDTGPVQEEDDIFEGEWEDAEPLEIEGSSDAVPAG